MQSHKLLSLNTPSKKKNDLIKIQSQNKKKTKKTPSKPNIRQTI